MQTTLDLFDSLPPEPPRAVQIGTHAWVLKGFALPYVEQLLQALATIEAQAPFRQMITPGGFTMSVALTNCGALGWTTDRRGYRYAANDPESGQPWPAMPAVFLQLACAAAAAAGFADFVPDACLINRYVPGARLSLHQDKDEHSYDHPIVSVSLGIPAVFLFGGHTRSDKAQRIGLMHGDIVVWGGEDRLRYHGVLPLKPAEHPLLGARRINFTFRKAG
ncbi:DNA oxidative demethylase AlkB [Pseudomonas sp. LS1212]|uniref:DNA oxidative demethylase AlkB n=1 Tax=Pseudomonas sp. LS1212 TaxID=2972478 RepID=UPI00215CFEC1|nr:DNA oxidative demethylase AlkB [Pseudomonas sp. LS1212]UVJ46046.1 DNA oxidative demethylase AlkB [Pseudomonas sp. LS1212]